jgi:thiol-disulfide isomerase/thioredoxin
MRIIPIVAAMTLLPACQQKAPEQPAANEAAAAPEGVGVKGVHRDHKGEAAPATVFTDGEKPVKLADFKGKPVLVNLWATWCAPCVKELPTLDKLAQSHRVDGQLGVVAVSQDMGPHASVEAFLQTNKIGDLGAFQDPKMALSGALGVEVMPTTILFDAQGREVWRYVGDLDWTSAEAAKLLAEAGVPAKG